MIFKLVAGTVLLTVLLIATGPRVVALWPQQSSLLSTQEYELSQPIVFYERRSELPDYRKSQNSLLEQLYGRMHRPVNDYEATLMRGLLLFQEGALDDAIQQLRVLTQESPRFELAHLILGDLLLSRVSPIDTMGSMAIPDQSDPLRTRRLEELRSEARARLQGYLSLLNADKIPQALITLSENTEHALVIDKSKHRLYVYRNSGRGLPPLLVDDFYIVLGQQVGDKTVEGDLKTPTGTYFVTSYLAPERLPPLYGSGAFPINYPNEFDRRQQKTGYGIWLHGTDRSLFSRPPLDTEGCVVLTNDEFIRIRQYIKTGRTPVIISESLEWLSQERWQEQKQEIKTALELWRKSWQDSDLESYLKMYAKDFWAPQHNIDSWSDYKKQVFAGKTFQQIDMNDLSLLGYPRSHGSAPVIVANFVQRYRSNNYNGDMRKRMYLIMEQGQWKVLYEGRQ